MQNKKHRFAGKGYYIALIACIAAVGISGYVFVRTAQNAALETMAPPAAVEQTTAPSAAPKPAATAAPSPAAPSVSPKSTAAPKAASKTQTAASSPDLMEDAYEPAMAPAVIGVIWPVQGDVVAAFSRETLTYSQTMADWRTHEGLDIAADYGVPVTAAQEGSVTAVYEDDYLGNVVVVSHSGDLATLYANLTEEPAVAVGDRVLAGEVLGYVGNSALLEASEPSHLHFEVFENGNPVDPLEYLPG